MATVLTTTWDGANSRVRLQLSGAVGSTVATFSVRLSGTTQWSTIRGGTEVPLTSGNAVIFDYEFPVSADDPLLLGEDTLLGPELLLAGSSAEYRAVTDASGTALSVTNTDLSNQTWLKFPAYPFRNRRVTVVGRGSVSRDSRTQLISVTSNILGTAVGEFMTGRTTSLTVRTESWADYIALDTALSLGSILLLHADQARLGIPNIYAVVTSVQSEPVGKVHGRARNTTIELVEVSRPHDSYAAARATFATVLENYADFQELFDTYDTYGELLELEGSGEEVIVE